MIVVTANSVGTSYEPNPVLGMGLDTDSCSVTLDMYTGIEDTDIDKS